MTFIAKPLKVLSILRKNMNNCGVVLVEMTPSSGKPPINITVGGGISIYDLMTIRIKSFKKRDRMIML
jgi:hypothetical protein